MRLGEYLKFVDKEHTGQLTVQALRRALTNLARMPPPDLVAKQIMAEKQVMIVVMTRGAMCHRYVRKILIRQLR
jgi:Ca2+-binding EF-hand superfamily protein